MKISPINLCLPYFKANKNKEIQTESRYITLNHYSCFFRDNKTNKFIKDYVINNFSSAGPLNIVSAGCSSGEEVYSLAIMFDDIGQKVNVSGFDVSEQCIQAAKNAVYTMDTNSFERNIPLPSYLASDFDFDCVKKFNKYFIPTGNKREYKLKDGALNNCSFFKGSVVQLYKYYQPESMDIIFCRNTLYHLANKDKDESEIEKKLSYDIIDLTLKNMNKVLKKGGIVVLSEEEADWGLDMKMVNEIMKKNGFEPIDDDFIDYRKLKAFYLQHGLFKSDSYEKVLPHIFKKVSSINHL